LTPQSAAKPRADQIAIAIATGFGIGLIPMAPGTWGSILGLAAGIGLHFDNIRLLIGPSPTLLILALQALVFLSMTILGIWSIERTEKSWAEHDSGKIVWDEVLGQMMPILVVPLNAPNLLLGFALFRLFDIWKPGPIGWADRNLPGAWGTLCDDLIAGICAAAVLFGMQAPIHYVTGLS
jgi:phosphatidylglycerophosphatase A